MRQSPKAPRGQYGEKKVSINVNVTPTAAKRLNAIALEMGISRSELLEQIGRGRLLVVKAQDE